MQIDIKKIEISISETQIKQVAGKYVQLHRIVTKEQDADKFPINLILKNGKGKIRSWYNHADIGPYSPSLFDARFVDNNPFFVPDDEDLFVKLESADPNTTSAKAMIFYRIF